MINKKEAIMDEWWLYGLGSSEMTPKSSHNSIVMVDEHCRYEANKKR